MNIIERKQLVEKKELFISCIVPVYNEEANIEEFLSKLTGCLQEITCNFEVIVVDDGSKDKTVKSVIKLSKKGNIKLVAFSRNFGKEFALTAGLDHCTGQVAILIDADFQHPIELIPRFVSRWSKGYDMVYGKRKNRNNESRVKRNFANAFYWLMTKITKINIPSNAGDFRLLDRKIITSLNDFNERTRFMKGLYAWVGYKTCSIKYDVSDRVAGTSAWGFAKLTELAITGILSFSDIPLRVWSLVGFVISLVSLLYAIYMITTTLIFGTDMPGFPSIIIAVMFFGGIQLLSIGILGEYVARIFAEVKQRPNYIVNYKYGFDEA